MDQYGIIGYPLSYTFSPTYFNEKFKREGIDAVYTAYPLEHITNLPELLRNNPGLKGLNVTIPHKTAVIHFLSALDAAAEDIGAVNCIKITDGKLVGHNTDVTGFKNSLVPYLQPHHTKALILGTGGSSKAVRYVLAQLGITCQFVSRSGKDGAIRYEDLNEAVLAAHPLIINCSPVGMTTFSEEAPALPYQHITAAHYLYDLIYKPEETPFLQRGRAQGAITKNGWDMLIGQAEANWEIWNKR